jgi:hypothetical protein
MHARLPSLTARIPATRVIAASAALLLGGAMTALLRTTEGGGWHVAAFAVMPDIALLVGIAPGLAKGQLHPRAVPLYNALHHPAGPALLALASVGLGAPWLAGALAWGIHIAVDRAVGYGPRTPEGFQRG